MTNFSQINTLIDGSTTFQQVEKLLQGEEAKRILLSGTKGSFLAFIIGRLHESDTTQDHIVICNDKEEAAYLQNTIENITESHRIHFFPDSFKKPLGFDELNRLNILQRTECVNQLTSKSNHSQVLITYPEALFEKVVDPRLLEEQKIVIEKGEDLDVDTVIDVLIEYGFERVDFVYEPGQFSIRGGIVDIFSYGNEWPYRIELFDEEIETIRTFNPMDQLSIKNIQRVTIIPNINQSYQEKDKVPVLEIFEKNTCIWISDVDMLLEKLTLCQEKAEDFAKKVRSQNNEDLVKMWEDRAFLHGEDIINSLEPFHSIFLKEPQQLPLDARLSLDLLPQPSFNRNFTLLIEDLKEKETQGYAVYIFTDSAKQVERFHAIFEDLDAGVSFVPVLKSIHEGFIAHDLKICCYTDHQIFDRFHRYKLRKGFTQDQSLNLKMLRELQPGDFVTHIDHGVGRYSGLEKIEINGNTQESVRLIYSNNDILYVSINSLHKISRYVGKDGHTPRLDKIGGDTWKKLKSKTKKKIKDIAKELIKLYAKRKSSQGHAFPPDGYLQNELEASFIYEDTPDQLAATNAMKEDMIKDYPMDRLICGDVGFGKTEVAIRGAFKAVVGGKQVAILVPTTILALQHAQTFKKRLQDFGVSVDYINRFRTTKEKNEIYRNLEEGNIDIIIGTHAILNKKVKFKDLGLLVIDEEQKFGVAAKEKLRHLKANVDTLTLTATPIPRTLQFSLMAARDLSIIRTPPPNRQPIHTERRVFNDELIKDAIYYEVNRGGQVFFVHNRVKNLAEIASMVQRLCPDVNVRTAHGQMDSKELEKQLLDFIDGKYDVLISTNIIETGLDIPNANTIIINNAHHFGMSDLHQLRGRVGRSNTKAFCYLFAPPISVLTPDARKRIKTLEEFSDLGSGFHIAMRDLDIRGAGNLLGGEQSGFISDIGYDTYQKILEEAIIELKESDFKDVFEEVEEKNKDFVRDLEVDTDIEMLIPDAYVSNIQERLSLYTELNGLADEASIINYEKNLKDRFGPLPAPVYQLFHALRIRWIAKKLGFEKVSLKKNKLRCYFIRNPQSPFYESQRFQNILSFVSKEGTLRGYNLKQSKTYLILAVEGIKDLERARKELMDLMDATTIEG